jgi:hypothetical protein
MHVVTGTNLVVFTPMNTITAVIDIINTTLIIGRANKAINAPTVICTHINLISALS